MRRKQPRDPSTHTQRVGKPLRPPTVGCTFGHSDCKASSTTGLLDKSNQGRNPEGKQDDGSMARVGNSADHVGVERTFKADDRVVVVDEGRAEEDTEQKRDHHFFGPERQDQNHENRDDRYSAGNDLNDVEGLRGTDDNLDVAV